MRSGELRKLVFVPVSTRPQLDGCWSVNLAESGIGLVAQPSAAHTPLEGETLSFEFPLPSGAQIFGQGVVRWRHESDQASGLTSFGVRFESFEGNSQVELLRFLSEYRVRVVVAGATAALVASLSKSFGEELQLEALDDEAALSAALSRGDVSTLLVVGDVPTALRRVALARKVAEQATAALGRPEDIRPRVVFAARASSDQLVDLFNTGAIDATVAAEADLTALASAVRSACRDHGMRLQQQRMAVELERVLRDRRRPLEPAPATPDGPGFDSAAMREVMNEVRQLAGYKVTVLLQGATGTGKEVLSRRLHRLSPRAQRPFVVQDCGALAETLLDSELFGHVKGSFTGAVADHPGLFVLADGGTIFLDEIENTTPNLQAKLLRVLETGEVRPVGGSTVRRVDVRVVAASNKSLYDEAQRGTFRLDLYYRLSAFLVEVPSLRERREDVVPLARAFVDSCNAALGKSARGFDPAAEAALLAWSWPGNVRELRNVVERAVLYSGPMELLGLDRLPKAMRERAAVREEKTLKTELERVELQLMRDALAKHGNVVRRAAKELGVDAQTFTRRARKLGAL
ncbi:MAG: sigma 54-interacting transcriptional regulator [Archangiaceae bacterium]|nr:sigma 54-interacting transcriptional regulator [Archangiaceae bacterium]